MFGVGGYDKFIAGFISDFKDDHEMDGIERNNGGSGSVLPETKNSLQESPPKMATPNKKKVMNLIFESDRQVESNL
ncbi:hypothetical protein FRC06_003948, partial [Ceratobasidium sp. 370]